MAADDTPAPVLYLSVPMRGVRTTLFLGCVSTAALAFASASVALASSTSTRGGTLSAHDLRSISALIRSRSHSARHRGYLIPPRAHPSIVGGSEATQGTWGFMAFVAHFDVNRTADFWCSGTLITPNVVLTAGHCAADDQTGQPLDPSGYAVETGAVNIEDAANRHWSDVSQVVVEPAYDANSYAGDAALLVLAKPVTAPTVRIAGSDETDPYTPGRDALIAGWGLTDPNADSTGLLEAAPTNVRGSDYCERFWDDFQSAWDTCAAQAFDPSTATCNGDSGGPLLTADTHGDPVEIGVTSVGPKDCNWVTADYFTRTDVISQWAAEFAVAVGPTSATTSTTTTSSSSSSSSTSTTTSTSTSTSTTTTTTATTTPPPAKPPVVIIKGIPPLTLAEARAHAATMVRARTHKRPRLTFSCRQVNKWTVHCSIRWQTNGSAYALSGKFFNYIQGTGAYWWYDFTGTRRWKTCRVRHHRRACTAYVRRFRWT